MIQPSCEPFDDVHWIASTEELQWLTGNRREAILSMGTDVRLIFDVHKDCSATLQRTPAVEQSCAEARDLYGTPRRETRCGGSVSFNPRLDAALPLNLYKIKQFQ
jgi:hypothetical protein